MAIFASTTTSGYSDPLKAQSIKALEQRLKDQQAQAAAQQPDAAMMATIPGGIGHVLGQVGDRMAQARTEQAVAAQRDMLSKAMTGYDVNSGPPPPAIATADPELYKSMLQQWAENRRQKDLFGHQDEAAKERYKQEEIARGQGYTHSDAAAAQKVLDDQVAAAQAAKTAEIARQQGYTHSDAAAAQKVLDDQVAAKEAARVAEIARGQEDTAARARDAQKALDAEVAAAANENRIQSRPTDDDLVKAKRAFERGEINQEEFDLRKKKLTQGTPAEQKFIVEQQMESVNNQSTLGTLDTALAMIDHPDSIFAGKNADWRTGFSGRLPEKLTGLSEKTRENTATYNKIMGGQALQQLTQMKGASSDKDVKINFDIANDPNATADEKKRAIGVLKEKLAYYVKINNAAIEGAGGTAPKLGGGAATADPLEGKTASGPGGPIIRRGGKWVPNG